MNGSQSPSTAGAFKLEEHPVGQNGRKLQVAMSESPSVKCAVLSAPAPPLTICVGQSVGSGFSGITAAIRLEQRLPEVEFDIFEKNYSVGGTWYENA